MKKITWLIIAITLIFSVVSLDALASSTKGSGLTDITPAKANQSDLVTFDKPVSVEVATQKAMTASKVAKITPAATTAKVATANTKKTVITKTVAVKTTTQTAVTAVKWDASALKIINNPASFDRNKSIRNAYAKKVESYAKRNNIKVITAKVINDMRE